MKGGSKSYPKGGQNRSKGVKTGQNWQKQVKTGKMGSKQVQVQMATTSPLLCVSLRKKRGARYDH